MGLGLAALLAVAACDDPAVEKSKPAPSPRQQLLGPKRPAGGVVRLAVSGEPDPAAPTLAGDAVRSLVLPQLFAPGPKGWVPLLVDDFVSAVDNRSAEFRLRNVSWSDGSALDAEDLRRSQDSRLVESVSEPDATGLITVRFNHPLDPNLQRSLWSGRSAVAAPAPDVWGGPFEVAEYSPGAELVLKRRDGWISGRPFVDELRLVVVPDPDVARRLLEAGRVDVIEPAASTTRLSQLRGSEGVKVSSADGRAWSTLITLNQRVDAGVRAAMAKSVDRRRFVDVLLGPEASRIDGWPASSGKGPWSADLGLGDVTGAKGADLTLVGAVEEPLAGLLLRSSQRQLRSAGAQVDIKQAEMAEVEAWVDAGAFDAGVVSWWDGPGFCYSCRWGAIDSAVAKAADGGDRAAAVSLQAMVRDQNLALPLWSPDSVVAWRTDAGLNGPAANGWALTAAWNAWSWWFEK